MSNKLKGSIDNSRTGTTDLPPLEFEPPQSITTHVIVTYPTADIECLFRAKDGIMVAQRKRLTIVVGEAPERKSSRVFMDAAAARRYLREVCAPTDIVDSGGRWKRFAAWLLGPPEGIFEERNAEKTLAMPGDVDIPQLFR